MLYLLNILKPMSTEVNVNVKMYRVGELGDCFLLRFSQKTKNVHILIDCGSFRNSATSIERLNRIAGDIKKQIGTDVLDVVVGTHQHNDHLSGFHHAKAVFSTIPIKQVWLPWLDDPADPSAIKVQEQHRRLVGLVHQLSHAFSKTGAFAASEANMERLGRINDVLGFYGMDGTPSFSANGEDPFVPLQGLKFLKSAAKNKLPNYLSPGTVFDLPGLPPGTVKVYVLGPPRQYEKIKSTNPRAGETFDHSLALALDRTEQFLSALMFNAKNQDEFESTHNSGYNSHLEENYPFKESEKIYEEPWCYQEEYRAIGEEKKALFLKTKAGKLYHSEETKWQQIDMEWLEQAETLALYLNNLTNNSSLVLAFELVEEEKVLLFVGDAQTGNWRSWTEAPWPEGTPKNKTEKLLKNTVLYKVGHHASHNATYKPWFELMRHPELAVMIPVDKNDANISGRKNPWKMPAQNLYKALKTQANFRVIRMDDGIPLDCQGKNKTWEEGVKETDLYFELNIK